MRKVQGGPKKGCRKAERGLCPFPRVLREVREKISSVHVRLIDGCPSVQILASPVKASLPSIRRFPSCDQ